VSCEGKKNMLSKISKFIQTTGKIFIHMEVRWAGGKRLLTSEIKFMRRNADYTLLNCKQYRVIKNLIIICEQIY
jgi:hypothetical protein